MRQDDSRNNGVGTRQISDEIQDVFGTARYNNNTRTDLASRNVFWNASTHGRHVLVRLGSVFGG